MVDLVPDLPYTASTTDDQGMPVWYRDADFSVQQTMGQELIESLIKQRVDLYRIDAAATESNFYGESKNKTFKIVVELIGRVQISDQDAELQGGLRRVAKGDLIFHVYQDHLDTQNVDVIIGDYLKFEGKFYEVYDHGPNRDENQRRLGVDREFFRTILATAVHRDVFSGK